MHRHVHRLTAVAESIIIAGAESRLRKARWRQWADEQLQQQELRPDGGPVAPPPPAASADTMSPEVAAAVQRQQPFIRRQPDAAAQQTGADADSAQPLAADAEAAQPATVVHIPAEVLTMCLCNLIMHVYLPRLDFQSS